MNVKASIKIFLPLIFLVFLSQLNFASPVFVHQETDTKKPKTKKKLVTQLTDSGKKINKDLQAMAETEKAFSATAVKEGFRDSFIKFFADDGIGFAPAPQITKSELMKTAASTAPRAVIFKWQPMFGDISLDGDMGYTTGPLIFEDITANPKPPRHGMYFSVWQKQADGGWKVAIDMGISTPQAVAPIDVNLTEAANSNIISKSKAKNLDKGNYETLDADFSTEIKKSGLSNAYTNWTSDEFRIHRNGLMPVVTKDALKQYLKNQKSQLAFKQMGGKISTSKDFAFTYGSFGASDAETEKADGYYVHVWRRDKSGRWKLVVDVTN